MRPPGVRHTAATMMLDSGTTVSAIAKWLGHDPAMTLRGVWPRLRRGTRVAGDALLGRSRASSER